MAPPVLAVQGDGCKAPLLNAVLASLKQEPRDLSAHVNQQIVDFTAGNWTHVAQALHSEPAGPVRLGLLGPPGVGKSMLMRRIIAEDASHFWVNATELRYQGDGRKNELQRIQQRVEEVFNAAPLVKRLWLKARGLTPEALRAAPFENYLVVLDRLNHELKTLHIGFIVEDPMDRSVDLYSAIQKGTSFSIVANAQQSKRQELGAFLGPSSAYVEMATPSRAQLETMLAESLERTGYAGAVSGPARAAVTRLFNELGSGDLAGHFRTLPETASRFTRMVEQGDLPRPGGVLNVAVMEQALQRARDVQRFALVRNVVHRTDYGVVELIDSGDNVSSMNRAHLDSDRTGAAYPNLTALFNTIKRLAHEDTAAGAPAPVVVEVPYHPGISEDADVMPRVQQALEQQLGLAFARPITNGPVSHYDTNAWGYPQVAPPGAALPPRDLRIIVCVTVNKSDFDSHRVTEEGLYRIYGMLKAAEQQTLVNDRLPSPRPRFQFFILSEGRTSNAVDRDAMGRIMEAHHLGGHFATEQLNRSPEQE